MALRSLTELMTPEHSSLRFTRARTTPSVVSALYIDGTVCPSTDNHIQDRPRPCETYSKCARRCKTKDSLRRVPTCISDSVCGTQIVSFPEEPQDPCPFGIPQGGAPGVARSLRSLMPVPELESIGIL